MDLGAFSVSLAVEVIEASRRFVAEIDEAGSWPRRFVVVDPDGKPTSWTSTSDRAA